MSKELNTVNTNLVYNILEGTIFNIDSKELDILAEIIIWCLSEPTIKVGESYFDYDAKELPYWPAHYYNFIGDKYNLDLSEVSKIVRSIETKFNAVETERQKRLLNVTLFKKDLIMQQIVHVAVIHYHALQYFM